MARVMSESRSRVGIDWYDDETEAVVAGRKAMDSPFAADANIGIVQVGRDKAFDREVDGVKWYAVVTP